MKTIKRDLGTVILIAFSMHCLPIKSFYQQPEKFTRPSQVKKKHTSFNFPPVQFMNGFSPEKYESQSNPALFLARTPEEKKYVPERYSPLCVSMISQKLNWELLKEESSFKLHEKFIKYALMMHVITTRSQLFGPVNKDFVLLKYVCLMSQSTVNTVVFKRDDTQKNDYVSLFLFGVKDEAMLIYKHIVTGDNHEEQSNLLITAFLAKRYPAVKNLYTFSPQSAGIVHIEGWKQVESLPIAVNTDLIPEAKDQKAFHKQFIFFGKEVSSEETN